jgi:hypothetical protein
LVSRGGAVVEERMSLPAADVVFVFPNESVAQVPPERMLEVVRAERVLLPDIRFVGAVAETWRIVKGARGKLRVAYDHHRWTLTLDGNVVGSLADTASYVEALDLLRSWSTTLLRTHPRLTGAAPEGLEAAARRAGAEDPFSERTIEDLEKLDAAWSKGIRSPESLDLAGRGLVTLCLQSLDRVGVGDPIYAKALAFTALREASQSRRLPEEEALLASLMGYRTDAEALVETLAESSPTRLWTGRDTKRFRAEAERPDAGRRLRYLFLLRLASETNIVEWTAWLGARCPELRGGIPFARAALELNDFGPDRQNAGLMLDVLSLEMADAPRAAGVWAALRRLMEEAPATRDLIALFRVVVPAPPPGSPGVLRSFEDALAAKTGRTGSLVDPDTERAYYRCLFYSALYTLGIYELDRRGSAPDALDFARSLRDGPPGPAADFSRWFGDLARTSNDAQNVSLLIEDLDGLRALGQPAIERVGDDALRILPANDPRNAAAAAKYGRRLDARPSSRLAFGVLCLNEQLDIPCYERYYGSAVRAWGRQWYAAFPGFLRRAGGRQALLEMVADPSVKASARVLALQILDRDGSAGEDLTSLVLAVATDDPSDTKATDYACRFLQDHGRFHDAETLLRRDLRDHPDASDLRKAQQASSLAEVLLLEGRNEEAWNAVQPWLATGKSDAYEAGSLALEALGRSAEALKMAQARLNRYPGASARAGMAELLWMQGRAADVPPFLQDPRYPINPFDWKNEVGPAFRDAFAHRSTEEMQAAFAILVGSGINPWYLAEMSSVLARANRFDAAFTLLTTVTARQPGVGAIDPRFDAYRYLRAWKGEDAAVAWVQSALTPQLRFRALEATLDEGLLDLFWKIEDPPAGPHGADNVALLRAAAYALSPAKAEDRRARLRTYFEGHRDSSQSAFGLYLTGVTPQAEFLRLASDPSRRAGVAYCVGLKTLGSQQFEEASEWLLIALETATPNTKDYQSAKNVLFRWARDGVGFDRMAKEPLF